MRKIAVIAIMLVVASANAYAQSYDQRMRDHRLPDGEPSSAGLQMFRFGGGRVGEPVYVKESPRFTEYTMPAAQFVEAGKGGPIRITLRRTAQMPIYLDTVVMDVNGKMVRPIKALADGKDVTAKLRKRDEDCACFEELTLEFPPVGKANLKEISLKFTAAAGSVEKSFALPAQQEGPTVVQSPKYFNYKPGSKKGTIVLDGNITPKDQLGRASLVEQFDLAKGEGKMPIRMWVRDDGSDLSVVLDVAADNTPSEADDKTVLYIRGKGPLKSFTAGAAGGAYGRMGAAYTSASKMEHRVYEFVIPFSQLPPLDDKGKWGISFAVTM